MLRLLQLLILLLIEAPEGADEDDEVVLVVVLMLVDLVSPKRQFILNMNDLGAGLKEYML